MQSKWKKVGAALGCAVMIGATLAGAALAEDGDDDPTTSTVKDLGDYQDLMVSTSGAVTGMFVVGAEAAAADVVTAIDMAGYVANSQVSGDESGTGDITLTPIETVVSGVDRHVGIDNTARYAYEFGGLLGPQYDKIGPAGYASGDGVVPFLYSYKEKGPTYVDGVEKYWHEDVQITNANINASRDNLDTNAGDQYDEVFLKVQPNTIQYQYVFDNSINTTAIKGKKIWFMGAEYTVISATTSKIKLGSTDSEVVLTTVDPTTTISGVDATLGGIYAVGTSGLYKAKVTITNGGTTETKYVASGDTDTIAGIEVYVQNAVVTTSGTNEGEAQMVVGAGILKLEDGDYLKLGDGTETMWQVDISSTGVNLDYIYVTDTEPHVTVSTTNTVLYPGDSITVPNGLFGLTYNGLTDKYGGEPTLVNVDLMPTTRNLGGTSAYPVIRIRTPDGDYIAYNDPNSIARTTNEVWVNATQNISFNQTTTVTQSCVWARNVTAATTSYWQTAATQVQLTTANTILLYFDMNSTWGSPANTSVLFLTEPALIGSTVRAHNITIEYDPSQQSGTGAFWNISSGVAYVYYDFNSSDGWIARRGATEPMTRDYYTKWGTYFDSVGQSLVSMKMPAEQLLGEYIVGTQSTGEGETVTVAAGETATIGGETIEVSGSVSGQTSVTLPATLAKLDSQVTAADKSTYTLVLVGGPKVNTLVNQLQTEGKLLKTIGITGDDADITAKGMGVIELIGNAFVDGKYAVVVAGTDRTGTSNAGNILANFDSNKAALDGKLVYEV